MRMLTVALAATLLAGCAGSAMNEARTQAPYKTLTSDKPEQVVAQCVQFSWQDEAVFGVDAGAYLQTGKKGGSTVYTRSRRVVCRLARRCDGHRVELLRQT